MRYHKKEMQWKGLNVIACFSALIRCFNVQFDHLNLIPLLTLSFCHSVSCRWRSTEWTVLVIIPGCGGHLVLGSLHLRLPHAGLPLLQEGQDWLQGGLSICFHVKYDYIWGIESNHTFAHKLKHEFMDSCIEMCMLAFPAHKCYCKWPKSTTFLTVCY